MTVRTVRNRLTLVGAAVVIGLCSATAANADSVALVDTAYTVGAGSAPQINALNLSGPGTLTVTLSDIAWPQPLAGVMFEVTSATGAVLATDSVLGTETFSISGAGTYYALSYGIAPAAKGALAGFGTYGLSLSFLADGSPPSTVPLPPSLVLLASALGLLGASRGREGAAIKV